MPSVCAQCGRQFAHPSRLSAHVARVHDKLRPHVCRTCQRAFSDKGNRDRHERTEHRGLHKLHCAMCGKGYDNPRWLTAHEQAHDRAVTAAIPLPRGLVAAEMLRRMEQVRDMRQQTQLRDCCRKKAGQCQVSARECSDQKAVFSCGRCGSLRHWACAGYGVELAALSFVVCPPCFTAASQSPATCEMALFNRRLVEAHVASLGQQIVAIPADGWCLVRSVATSVQRDRHELLEAALTLLVGQLATLPMDEAERDAVARDCNKLLQQGRRQRQMQRQWDSALCDLLPQALADVVQRPLHILQAANCEIRAVVTSPAHANGEAPIILVRSFNELGFDHYDAVRLRVA